MPAADEQQLITEAKSGSREAFRCLVERYMKQAYTIAYGFVNDHHGAEEIAQDAFVLFGITILKIFIYDLSFLETLYRIFSFIGLGVVLLVVSYLYQHYKDVIFQEQPNEKAETEETTA